MKEPETKETGEWERSGQQWQTRNGVIRMRREGHFPVHIFVKLPVTEIQSCFTYFKNKQLQSSGMWGTQNGTQAVMNEPNSIINELHRRRWKEKGTLEHSIFTRTL